MTVLVCGVDEAGRGAMLGPLVVAGISVPKSKIKKLASMGIKDSKLLSPSQRLVLYKKIIKFADGCYVSRINPKTIDKSVARHKLNDLEAKYMAKVILKLNPDVSYVDSCDVNPKRFGKKISDLSKSPRVRSYHKADTKYVIVSAASIVAKVCRDREIARLKKRHAVGSGYPSDARTVRFVRNYIKKNKCAPEFVRTSWKPVRLMLGS